MWEFWVRSDLHCNRRPCPGGEPTYNIAMAVKNGSAIKLVSLTRHAAELRLRLSVFFAGNECSSSCVPRLREESLPESIKAGGSVRKGTVLTFTRDHAGTLSARADEHELVIVQRCAMVGPRLHIHHAMELGSCVLDREDCDAPGALCIIVPAHLGVALLIVQLRVFAVLLGGGLQSGHAWASLLSESYGLPDAVLES